MPRPTASEGSRRRHRIPRSCYLDSQDHRGTPSYRGRTGLGVCDLYINDMRAATAQPSQESALVFEAFMQTLGNMPLMPTWS